MRARANQGMLFGDMIHTAMKNPDTSLLPIRPDAPWLAPLAGFSDLPFRLICREMGAVVACTEMVSAKGLIYGLRKKGPPCGTEDLLATTPEDTPLVVQLFGEEPEFIAEATTVLKERAFRWFDLNMGCSVRKVTKTGAGAALLKDRKKAVAAAKALFDAAGPGNAGAKIRLGWDAASPIYLDLAKELEDAGAAWITLHPRFATQAFSGVADRKALTALASHIAIPVIASGDLMRAEDALLRVQDGASAVMFARGAMANPAVFRAFLDLLAGRPCQENLPASALHGLIRRHAELARRLTPGKPGRSGISPALLKMRTVVPRYVRHLPGAKQLRLALTRCEGWEELEGILTTFFANCPQEEEQCT